MGALALLALVLAVPASVRADTIPLTPARAPALPVHGRRPAEIVAAQVRSVLGDHGNARAWKELAGVLPEMALVGDADLERTFEAARLADSISSAADEPELEVASAMVVEGTRTSAPPPVSAAGTSRWRELSLNARSLAAGAIVVAFVLGATILGRRRSRKRPEPARERQGRVWAARSLASSGMSVREIARRTGMAQDAVHVLLGLAERNPIPHPPPARRYPGTSPGRPANSARRLDAERDRLKAEIAGGARRLRDGRVTYGGGR